MVKIYLDKYKTNLNYVILCKQTQGLLKRKTNN